MKLTFEMLTEVFVGALMVLLMFLLAGLIILVIGVLTGFYHVPPPCTSCSFSCEGACKPSP